MKWTVEDEFLNKSLPWINDKTYEFFCGKRIALVGPAPSLEGTKSGCSIDSYDVVCRMNHHVSIEDDTIIDYGGKTDALFSDSCIIEEFYTSLQHSSPDLICFLRRAGSGKHGAYPKIFREIQKRYPDVHCYHSGNHYEDEWNEHIGSILNTGWLAVIFLLRLRIEHLHVTGFDFYQDKRFYRKHIRCREFLKHRPGEQNKYLGHNQINQIKLLSKLHKDHPDRLSIDETLQDILKEHD